MCITSNSYEVVDDLRNRMRIALSAIKGIALDHWLAILVLLIYFSPFIFTESRHLIHDNLDSNVVWYSNLAKSGALFGSNDINIDMALGGIPRGCYPSEFNFNVLFYFIFPPNWAYAFNFILIHIIAYIGFYLLVFNYITIRQQFLSQSLALAFALIPFWPSAGLSIAGQPLLFYIVLKFYEGDISWRNIIILLLLPFYSSFYFSGFYLAPLFFVIILYFTKKERRVRWKPVLLIGTYFIIGILIEYRLFMMEFFNDFNDHRETFSGNPILLGHLGMIKETTNIFINGQYHMQGLQFLFAPILLLFLVIGIFKPPRIMFFILATGFVYTILFVLPNYGPFSKIGFFQGINLRWIVILPLIWYIVLAYCLNSIKYKGRARNLLQTFFLGLIIINSMFFVKFPLYSNFYSNLENPFYYSYINTESKGHSSFREFYRKDEINELKRFLSLGNGKYSIVIANLGNDNEMRFVPEVLQYNGIRTLDAYFFYFPVERKKLIFEITKDELKKDQKLNTYFSNWGSRCYFYSKDIQDNHKVIDDLDYDFKLLKRSGCNSVFSDRPILIKELDLIANQGQYYLYRLK